MGWLKKYQKGGKIKDERYQSAKTRDVIPKQYVKEDKYMSPELAAKIKAKQEASRPTLRQISKEEFETGARKAEAINNEKLSLLERPLIYMANPLKMVGDFVEPFVNNTETLTNNPFPTSEEDRLQIAKNRHLSSTPISDKLKQGLGYVPDAALNMVGGELVPFKGIKAPRAIKKLEYDIKTMKYPVKHAWNDRKRWLDAFTNSDTRLIVNPKYKHPDFLEHELAAGARTLDEALTNKLDLLSTPEGRKRLVNQEANYLYKKNIFGKNLDDGWTKEQILRQANQNADARIFELEHIKQFGNLNKNALEEITRPGSNQVRHAMSKHRIPEKNAYYRKPDEIPSDDIIRKHIDYLDFMTHKYKTFIRDVQVGGSQAPGKLTLGHGFGKNMPTADHEIAHALQRGRVGAYDDALKNVKFDAAKTAQGKLPYGQVQDLEDAGAYFIESPYERTAFLAELRAAMKERGLIKHEYDEITPELLTKAKASFDKKPSGTYHLDNSNILRMLSEHRILDFAKQTPQNYELMSKIMNKLPQVATPIVGAGAAAAASNKKENGGWLSKYQDGGIIEDDRGQWDHPGKVTKINSNNITMKGVNYPVLGISDTGDKQMMMPGEDYKFDGKSVTEYPMAQDGVSFPKGKKKGNFIKDIYYNAKKIRDSYEMADEVDEGWYKNWLENPETLKRLKETDYFPSEEDAPYQKQINNAVLQLETAPVYKKDFPKNVNDLKYNHDLQGFKTTDNSYYGLRNLSRFGPRVQGHYIPEIHSIGLNSDKKSTLAHEQTHATNAWSWNREEDIRRLFPTDTTEDKYLEDNFVDEESPQKVKDHYKEEYDYLKRDGIYPRIMGIRRALDLKPGQKVKQEDLDKLKRKDTNLNTLEYFYDDDKIIEIMNTIADTSKDKNKKEFVQKGKTIELDAVHLKGRQSPEWRAYNNNLKKYNDSLNLHNKTAWFANHYKKEGVDETSSNYDEKIMSPEYIANQLKRGKPIESSTINWTDGGGRYESLEFTEGSPIWSSINGKDELLPTDKNKPIGYIGMEGSKSISLDWPIYKKPTSPPIKPQEKGLKKLKSIGIEDQEITGDYYEPEVDYWNVIEEVNPGSSGGRKKTRKVFKQSEIDRLNKKYEADKTTKTGKRNKLTVNPVYKKFKNGGWLDNY